MSWRGIFFGPLFEAWESSGLPEPPPRLPLYVAVRRRVLPSVVVSTSDRLLQDGTIRDVRAFGWVRGVLAGIDAG